MALSEFVDHWDRLEQIVIHVYRGKAQPDAVKNEFDEIWGWLRENYRRWESNLIPYWQTTRAAGEPTQTDPFRLLLDIESPAHIQGDWRAMQHLPAAREAVNRYLVDHSQLTG